MIGDVYEVEDTSLAFEPTAKPVPAEERARLLADPGFGRVFTDHMRFPSRACVHRAG